jgi:hypothetical protein
LLKNSNNASSKCLFLFELKIPCIFENILHFKKENNIIRREHTKMKRAAEKKKAIKE